ncbi:MAG: zinc metallopeptidase [Pirellulales bacterium]
MFFFDPVHFNPMYWLFIAPAVLLGLWAQFRVRSTYAQAQQQPASLSGAAAARHILDSAGLTGVAIEPVQGFLSDHYDPRTKVLRLSPDVYHNRSMAAVGIAAHEAGHALQDAANYAPLIIRNAAVPAAGFGSGLGVMLIMLGYIMQFGVLLLFGIGLFACVVIFQIVNLPVEFNASSRAKQQLVALGIVPQQEMAHVNRVLNAAAWTYVAGTLRSILTLLYYVMLFMGGRRDD